MAQNDAVQLQPNSTGHIIDNEQVQVNIPGFGVTNVDRQRIIEVASQMAEGGLTPLHIVLAASTNAVVIKAGPGRVYNIGAFSTAMIDPFYIKLYDQTTLPNPATDVPKRVFAVQAGVAININLGPGIAFSTGIAMLVVRNVQNNDNTPVNANEGFANVDWA